MEYQKQYNKNHVAVSNALQTNGYALNEEWCQFLKENHFLVGLSLDGTEEIHNAHRHDKAGNGTYARSKHAADLMDQYQVGYNILTVVTADIAERRRDLRRIPEKWLALPAIHPLSGSHGGRPRKDFLRSEPGTVRLFSDPAFPALV